MYFDGDDAIAYRFRTKTVRTTQDMLGFNFKTMEREGLLMYAEGAQGDYISVELQQARLVLNISLGEDSGGGAGCGGDWLLSQGPS